MNLATFILLRHAMGYDQRDVADALNINMRTVQRWEAGVNPLPAFAQVWMDDRWQEFLDRIDTYMQDVEQVPAGETVTLAVYRSREALVKAGATLKPGQVEALNSALAVVLGLSDYGVEGSFVPEE